MTHFHLKRGLGHFHEALSSEERDVKGSALERARRPGSSPSSASTSPCDHGKLLFCSEPFTFSLESWRLDYIIAKLSLRADILFNICHRRDFGGRHEDTEL